MTADHEQPFRVERRGSTAAQRTAGIGALPPPAARLKPSWSVPSLG